MSSAAMRIRLSEADFIRFASSDEKAGSVAVTVESAMEEAKELFEDSEKAKHMKDLFALKDTGNAALYYEETARCVERLKSDYRDVVLESD